MPPFTEYLHACQAHDPTQPVPRTYGKHSDTRYLDEPAVSAWELVAREKHWPSSRFREGA